MGLFTKLTAVIAIILPYYYLYMACVADPGYVTPETHDYHMSLYSYDYIMFHPGRICKTCDLVKPPRSKHCSICKRCVARSDHHCIFINSCVGFGNHHYFLLLLLSTAVLTTYGGALGLSILSAYIRFGYPDWTLWPSKTITWTRWLGIFGLGVRGNVGLGAATLLAVLISPLIWGLLLYSVYLVYCGVTTNESLKWSEWKEDMHDGYAFARELPPHARRDIAGEPAWTRWPAQPGRIFVTTRDGQPPRPELLVPGEGEWERVRSLKNVDNIYDLGFWNNLKDIFILGYSFGNKGQEPISERAWPRSRTARNGAMYPP